MHQDTDGYYYLDLAVDRYFILREGDEVDSSYSCLGWRVLTKDKHSALIGLTSSIAYAMGWDSIRSKNPWAPKQDSEDRLRVREWVCPCKDLKNDVGRCCYWCGAAEGAR